MDAVQGCMDQLEPWLELTEGGGLTFSLNAVNGFIGGTVGVLGTVVAAQIKKGEVKTRLKCIYCDGVGQILCGHCFGTTKLSYMNEEGAVVLGERCTNCEATGSVVCINCQGSGLSVPDDFLQVLGDEEVSPTPTRGLDSSRCHGRQPVPVTPSHAMGSTPSRLVRTAGRLYRGGLHRPLRRDAHPSRHQPFSAGQAGRRAREEAVRHGRHVLGRRRAANRLHRRDGLIGIRRVGGLSERRGCRVQRDVALCGTRKGAKLQRPPERMWARESLVSMQCVDCSDRTGREPGDPLRRAVGAVYCRAMCGVCCDLSVFL